MRWADLPSWTAPLVYLGVAVVIWFCADVAYRAVTAP